MNLRAVSGLMVVGLGITAAKYTDLTKLGLIRLLAVASI